ncbi:E3 ubiquitin-protein ligase TRIM21-like [Odontesthes bonariensis]|uniref:E3 ubiquitin-protein ligase TRIM21-like n=1 Tax=Odontesthes bonariensis TaxID=219752 RepID=UPI003F58FFD4
MALPSESCSLEKDVTCSICMKIFTDPVTASCGHSFCSKCLNDQLKFVSGMCPLCKMLMSKIPGVNIALRQITQKLITPHPNEYTGAPGEVACDVCTQSKLKAEKSCLVCLASYCSTHIENHHSAVRLKGHRLVQPVENLDARACLTHGRPFELFSRRQQRCICAQCIEEGEEAVVSAEGEWHKKKVQLENTKTQLKSNIWEREIKVDDVNTALRNCNDQLDNESREIEAVFTAVFSIVEAAKATALQPLAHRRQLLEKEATDLKGALEDEISKLERTISELDDISALEDHIVFLQRFASLAIPDDIRDWTEVELDTSLLFGTMMTTTTKMMEQIQQELDKLAPLELKRLSKFTVDLKLDPETAHQRLVLSDDGKKVKDGGEDQEVADSLQRFDLFGSVLGSDGFTSGKLYWEVEVSDKTGWDLGVARGGAKRKGKLRVRPDNGYWVLIHYKEKNYAAMTAPPIRLSPKEKPKKVGVFVDYEEGLVSFYDVTAQSHIYSFSECSFHDELYPYFGPHVKEGEKNSEPLVILPGQRGEREMNKEWRRFCSISV